VENSSASTTAIGAQLFIVNNSMSAVDLNDLTVRYYLTNEVAAALMYSINWANIGAINGPSADFSTNQLSIVAVPMAMPVASADTYVEISFNAGNDDLPAGHRLHFSWTVQNFASQNFMQSGDYSFNAGASSPMDWQNVVLMHQGQSVVWGVEP
jgi:hypothetical protein